ncbi:unnamed protein product [Rotaria sp. Silwood2]|nr:unnamed protein product [Rotaria sp. Silwood2]CAF2937106.1 unnamed protein product [Rotaria sp. Silwood2]CAF4015154.1 unnamed protein product [Rotaria sp. Silwood2]
MPTVVTILSILMLHLVSVEGYCLTSRNIYQRQWRSVKNARISIIIALLFSSLLSIPDLFCVGITETHCGYISKNYDQYFTYFVAPVLLTQLPLSVLSTFGCVTH